MESMIAVHGEQIIGEGSSAQEAVMDAVENENCTLQNIVDGDVIVYAMVGTARFEFEAG